MRARTPGGRLVAALRTVNKKTMGHPRIRRVGITLYSTAIAAVRFLPPPRVLLNGHGKSGTHLLADCVALLPKMIYSGRHFGLRRPERENTPASSFSLPAEAARLERFLRRCPNGMFVTAHAGYEPWLAEKLAELGFRHIVLVRDPRDVVVSRAFFRAGLEWHPTHHYYAHELQDDEARIMAAIRGHESAGQRFESIGESYRRMLPWLSRSDVLVARFEDLVGRRGGGDPDKQVEAIRAIAEWVGRPIAPDHARMVGERMYSRRSATYRRGAVGDWRNHFTAGHRAGFEEVAGDLLVELGYEPDHAG